MKKRKHTEKRNTNKDTVSINGIYKAMNFSVLPRTL